MGPRYHLSFCACNAARVAPELLVSMGPSPYLWFWVHITVCLAQWLYGFQPSPVVLCMHNSDFSTWTTSLYGSQPSSVVFTCRTTCLTSEFLVSMGPSPYLWFLHAKQRLLDPNNKSLWVPDIACRFMHAKQRDLLQTYKYVWVPDLICGFEHT